MVRCLFAAVSLISLIIAALCPFVADQAEQSNAAPQLGAADAVIYGRIWPLFLILPIIWVRVRLPEFLRARVARRRANQNLCAACGYDLRASADRCPECGRPIPAKQEAAAISR